MSEEERNAARQQRRERVEGMSDEQRRQMHKQRGMRRSPGGPGRRGPRPGAGSNGAQ
jgi:hypothetical protein